MAVLGQKNKKNTLFWVIFNKNVNEDTENVNEKLLFLIVLIIRLSHSSFCSNNLGEACEAPFSWRLIYVY